MPLPPVPRPHPYFDGADRPRWLAHRGFVSASSYEDGMRENTVAAFAAADAAGARYIETDCRLTRDGVVVCAHDETWGRVVGDAREVRSLTARETERLLAPHGGLAVLADVLQDFPALRINVDVKSADAAEGVGRVAAAHPERVLVTSGSEPRRRAALQAAAGARVATGAGQSLVARLALACAVRAERPAAALLAGIDAVQVPERHRGVVPVLTDRMIEWCHRYGVEVHVWTINDPVRMRALLARGVDGIVTDRTDLAVALGDR